MIHERINPHTNQKIMKLSRFAHIKRYEKALEIIGSNKKILDAGCGYGYGTDILSKKNDEVIGIDICEEAINFAKKNYPNNSFYTFDLNKELSNLKSFDAITCFEVLEHIDEPLKSLKNFKDILNKKGKLIISIPNGNNASQNNEHHTKYYSPKELEEILKESGFQIKKRFGQYPLLGSLAKRISNITGYESNTNKESGIIPKIIDNIPLLPKTFSDIYESNIAVSTGRCIYFVAEK